MEEREVTWVCPDCGADGNKDEKHTEDCARGKGWAHAVKSDDERAG
jgi:rubredoxin